MISLSDIFSINGPNLKQKIIGQCDVKHIMALSKTPITSVIKFSRTHWFTGDNIYLNLNFHNNQGSVVELMIKLIIWLALITFLIPNLLLLLLILLLLPILCKSPLAYCRRLTPHAYRETASQIQIKIKNWSMYN